MSTVSDSFSQGCAEIRAALLMFPAASTDVPYRPGGWTRKQILGHMIDSAANNHQRFVRAALDGQYTGPGYAQEGWVNLHSYAETAWPILIDWWKTAHQQLETVVARIPQERFAAPCIVGQDAAVTLQFLIEDYIAHQRHHLAQILK
jgi:hypothetical protein